MIDETKISFSVKDTVLGADLSPSNTTLPILSEFINQVITFLKGDSRIDLTKIKSSVASGSLMVVSHNEAGILNKAISDYEYVSAHKSLDNIDPVRARILAGWQLAAKENELRKYTLCIGDINGDDFSKLTIDKNTNFKPREEHWVNVDLYLYGKVYDLGGKLSPNVHLELENGTTIKIGAHSTLLSQDSENRLYKDQLVRIKAKQNIYSHELRDEKLVSFEAYNPSFDEEEFNKISEKASMAWKAIPSASHWVEHLRGNNG
jgi:hypothetical protein